MTAENRRVAGCPGEARSETEGTRGAQSGVPLKRLEGSGAGLLLTKVLARENLNQAYKRVKRNGGGPGVDGMEVGELLGYLKEQGQELLLSLSVGLYRPQPVKRVEIPKPDGGKRLLGIPTVVDRMVQQAIAQILTPLFEPGFSESSYGFRPGRSAHQAIRKARDYHAEGYRYVVDIDLAQYFDTVNHDLLIEMLRDKVKDERLIVLIRRYLKSGVLSNGLFSPTTEGTPQGGNLSPLLSNIYLTGFDRLLEKRGFRFVRYADDCNIYVRSRRAADRVMESSVRYLEGRLKLRVNRVKSATGSPLRRKFLGFSLYVTTKGETKIRTHGKSIARFKAKLKYITRRNRGVPLDDILRQLKRYVRGWLGYYSIAAMSAKMQELTEWVRRRLRMYVWKQWKRIRTRLSNLKRLGVGEDQAWQWSNTRKGYWRTAGSPILTTTLTNKYLADRGFENISKVYEALHSRYRTAVYGSVCTVV